MFKSWEYYDKWKKAQKTMYHIIHLHDILEKAKI